MIDSEWSPASRGELAALGRAAGRSPLPGWKERNGDRVAARIGRAGAAAGSRTRLAPRTREIRNQSSAARDDLGQVNEHRGRGGHVLDARPLAARVMCARSRAE